MGATFYTVGHSTRSADELVTLLRSNDVTLLVDVRRYPGSRRHPQFNRESLAATLEAEGIRYRHAPELGGRRAAEVTSARNAGWRNAGFRAYADHMGSAGFRDALDRLVHDATDGVVAVMCAEAVPWRCHRQLIADALVLRGHTVLHITSPAAPSPHELNPMARPGPDGIPVYPGEAPPGSGQGEQPELFGT